MQSTTFGLSEKANEKLKELEKEGHIEDQVDGYRLGVALALAHQAQPPDLESSTTKYNLGTLDPDGELVTAVELLTETEEVTKDQIEGLAHWGIVELHQLVQDNGSIPLEDLRKKFVDGEEEAEG